MKAKKEYLDKFLENAEEQQLWIANKYISNPASDGGQTRIPTLKVRREDGSTEEVKSNEDKSKTFARTPFPPPPAQSSVPRSPKYAAPVHDDSEITRGQIRCNIGRLSPYKACGADGIPNILLKETVDVIIEHFYYLFKAVFELNVYYPGWQETITAIPRKPGKPDYSVPRAYRP